MRIILIVNNQLIMETSNSLHNKVINLTHPALPELNKLIDSEALFRHGDVVIILHKGEQYALRRTRNGKLILNK